VLRFCHDSSEHLVALLQLLSITREGMHMWHKLIIVNYIECASGNCVR
jgi:hypothetical protein